VPTECFSIPPPWFSWETQSLALYCMADFGRYGEGI
jgi:hypothetical protein